MSYFFDPANRAPLERNPGVSLRTAWLESMLLSQVDFEPNAAALTHSHPEEQISVVVRGEITMTVGEETRLLKPGDSILIPGDVLHGGRAGAEGATMIDVFSPVRKDLQY